MGGATHCSIVGCSTRIKRDKSFTFHNLPKKGGPKEEWRIQLLQKIDREDKNFNTDTAAICSKHFTEDCFKYGPKGTRSLISGCLPTECMPSKSAEVQKPPERKLPAERNPPDEVLRVCYYSLADVKKEAVAKLPAPWIIVKECDSSLTVGIIENRTLTVHVKIQCDLSTYVSVFDIPAPHLNKNIECLRLKTFLTDLTSQQLCLGVTDSQLQEFAQLPTDPESTNRFFLHVLSFDPDGCYCRTTVRSRQCILISVDSVCKRCTETRAKLLQMKKTTEEKETQPLKPNDPLHYVSKTKLKKTLKQIRQSEKKAHMELNKIRNKIQSESVSVSKDLHMSMEAVMGANELIDPFTNCSGLNKKRPLNPKESMA